MADKTLRLIFNGISTLFPAPPRGGEPNPDKAFVLMPANRDQNRTNDWKAPVPPHVVFIYVPVSILAEPIPAPAATVDDAALGRCNIYYIDHARVTLDRRPNAPIDYYKDKRDLAERPGSDDVASEHDIRWLADIRDIIPEQAGTHLRSTANPEAPGDEVAVVVEMRGGTFKANFPCKSVQPKTFRDAKGRRLTGFRRVLASEFFIEMPFPANTETVKLQLQPIRKGMAAAGIEGNELTLKWGAATTIDVRMGNDTAAESLLLTSFERCNARTRDVDGRPMPIPRDEDFHLHYELLALPTNVGRRLPQTGPHQTQFDTCSPLATS